MSDHPSNQFWKLLILCSFVMLSILTWASHPIQTIFEKIHHKETIKIKAKACYEMFALKGTYEDYFEKTFMAGCLWDISNIIHDTNLLFGIKSDAKDKMSKDFDDQDSQFFEKIRNYCAEGGASYLREGKLKEAIVSDLIEKLDCDNTIIEMEKLGIKPEDLEKK